MVCFYHAAAARRLPFVSISKWFCRRIHSEPMDPSVKAFRDSDKREPPNSGGMVVPGDDFCTKGIAFFPRFPGLKNVSISGPLGSSFI